MNITQQLVMKARFEKRRRQFMPIYKSLKALGSEPFVIEFWEKVNQQILKAIDQNPPANFLSIRILQDTMFVGDNTDWIEQEASFLQSKLGTSFERMIKEDSIGKPRLLAIDKLTTTSANTLHHLYHLHYFADQTKTAPESIKSVIEWGGGYGNFAKLWWRTSRGRGTYYIIDTALFCAIQWLYLGSVLGDQAVHLLRSPADKPRKGVINLIPLALLDKNVPSGDLFVSTWGLSESSSKAQDFVLRHRWFNAKHVLLGFQKSTDDLYNASRLGNLAEKDGITVSEIPFIKGNYYGFK